MKDGEIVVDEDVIDDLRVALVRCGAVDEVDRFGRAPENAGKALLGELRKAGYLDSPVRWVPHQPTDEEAEEKDNRVWLCAKCGYGSEEHGMENHPASKCVADMRLVDPRWEQEVPLLFHLHRRGGEW